MMYFTSNSGMKLKFVRIILNGTKVRVEPGALYYMNGNLEMKASTGGGIVLKSENRKTLKKYGTTFFLNASILNLISSSISHIHIKYYSGSASASSGTL